MALVTTFTFYVEKTKTMKCVIDKLIDHTIARGLLLISCLISRVHLMGTDLRRSKSQFIAPNEDRFCPQAQAEPPCPSQSTWASPMNWASARAEQDFPGGTSGKEPTGKCRIHKRHRFDQWVGKMPWGRPWQPTPVLLPGESHGQRSLVGYSPWGHKESDMTEATAQHSAAQC